MSKRRKKTIYIPNQMGEKCFVVGVMPDVKQRNKLRKEIEKQVANKGKK